MPTWLVTGAGGMLGRELVGLLHAVGEAVVPATHAVLDITEERAVGAAVASIARMAAGDPDDAVVVNLAAFTDVDRAEVDEAQARTVNVVGAQNVARACERADVRLIHLSTDYVFDGSSRQPYAEDAPIAPVTAYGRTKAAGERAVLDALPDAVVVRTGWLYGAFGHSFVRTMVESAGRRDIVEVVDDQEGQPTWAFDLADRLYAVGRRIADGTDLSGVLHATNSNSTSWYGLARAVFTELGLNPDRVRPIGSDGMPRLAPRPGYSVLGQDRWAQVGMAPMRPWREALAAAAPTVLTSDGNTS